LWRSLWRTGTLQFSTTHLTRQFLHLPTNFSSPSSKFPYKCGIFKQWNKYSVQWQGSLTTFKKLFPLRAWKSWRNVRTNVLIKEEYVLKNKNKLCPYEKLSVFYNTSLKTFGSHLVVWAVIQGSQFQSRKLTQN
jgi:hypothetical protein